MTSAIPPAKRVDLLLNTLVSERHLRQTLLSELVDVIGATSHSAAFRAGKALLESLENGLSEAEYETRLDQFVALARSGSHGRPAIAAA